MHHAQLILHVRQMIYDRFRQSGIESNSEAHESILIRDGYYCGRRFACEGLHAVWFFEDNQIKFYGSDGSVAEVISVAQMSGENRARVA